MILRSFFANVFTKVLRMFLLRFTKVSTNDFTKVHVYEGFTKVFS